jgi:hypothetical protein
VLKYENMVAEETKTERCKRKGPEHWRRGRENMIERKSSSSYDY